MITGRNKSNYRNCHGTISQNVLVACNFDLKFMYVLSGWEGSAHDSKVLSDALYFLYCQFFPFLFFKNLLPYIFIS